MFIIIYNIYIIYNNGSVNHPHSEKINYPTVIGVIVIADIGLEINYPTVIGVIVIAVIDAVSRNIAGCEP